MPEKMLTKHRIDWFEKRERPNSTFITTFTLIFFWQVQKQSEKVEFFVPFHYLDEIEASCECNRLVKSFFKQQLQIDLWTFLK